MSETPFLVMKFGGSSNGAPERLVRITELVARERRNGPVALVVSAMGDTTDWLIDAVDRAAAGDHAGALEVVECIQALALRNGLGALDTLGGAAALSRRAAVEGLVHELTESLRQLLYGVSLVRERTPQTVDLVMSFGERISAGVLAEVVSASGVEACFVDARTWTVTDDSFGKALVSWPATEAALCALRVGWGERVPVHTGFLGRTADGRTTTLGRNGSDYTATLLARALQAREVNIWTDVSGVMTADPGLVKDAYPLERLSYAEALELATFGTKMFHTRTMIPLMESGIPLRIRNTMRPEAPGTLVDRHGAQDARRPTSVTSLEQVALIDVQVRRLTQKPHVGERVLRALREANVTVWMATQSAHGQAIAVGVPMSELSQAVASIEGELALELQRGDIEPVTTRSPVTLLSLVAETMGRTPNVAGRFFSALGSLGINVRAIAQGASARSITAAIDAEDTPVAVRTVHAAFNFAHQEVSVLVLGKGTVGRALLEQLREQQALLRERQGVALRVVGVADSRRLHVCDEGLDLRGWEGVLAAQPAAAGEGGPVGRDALERLRRLPAPVLVDCTAAEGMDAVYEQAFALGVHVVSANKKPLTGSWERWSALHELAATNHRSWAYETTVGASLPVIETLKNLVRTGDVVVGVEGCFSGTLGFLCQAAMEGQALSEAVEEAWSRGYTEPQPAEDLSGMDVARKALILARELGLRMELSEVEVEPLVSTEGLLHLSREGLFAALRERNAGLQARVRAARERGEVLRYLARIERGEGARGRLHVGPVALPASHPATRLRGPEAFVAFTTERFRQVPMIVQGSGAGGEITAAGVLADLLTVARRLRGR
mgnify:CR=1 FL=1